MALNNAIKGPVNVTEHERRRIAAISVMVIQGVDGGLRFCEGGLAAVALCLPMARAEVAII